MFCWPAVTPQHDRFCPDTLDSSVFLYTLSDLFVSKQTKSCVCYGCIGCWSPRCWHHTSSTQCCRQHCWFGVPDARCLRTDDDEFAASVQWFAFCRCTCRLSKQLRGCGWQISSSQRGATTLRHALATDLTRDLRHTGTGPLQPLFVFVCCGFKDAAFTPWMPQKSKVNRIYIYIIYIIQVIILDHFSIRIYIYIYLI